jgi:cytosine/adenosine deaminase-related metal-dependent hydrolase
MMHASVALQHGGRHVSHETLDRAGWLGPSTKLAHAVYVSEPELDRLVERDVRIAHCPSAALRHAKGISRHGRVPEMLQAGLTVGLGGDSANGSNHFDMLRLMYLAATLYKDFRMDTRLLPPETALEMATLHGARCLGQERRIGSLETGKRADLVIFDTRDPEWRPLLDPVQNLVLSASSRSVDSVWVEGRQVVKEGRLLTIDLPRLLERVQRASSAVLERVELAPQPPWPIL